MKPTKQPNHRLLARVCSAICLVIASTGVQAGTFSSDFNTGTPAGINLYGSALTYDHSTGGVGNSGSLKITEAIASQNSSAAIIDDFDGGAIVAGFDVTFDLYIGSGNGADGFSFFFGDFADAAHTEEGPGDIQGLTIAFDVFNSGGAIAEAPAIDLKWNNVVLVHRLVGAASTATGAAPLGTATTIRTQPTQGGAAVFWPVKVHVDTDGTLDLTYNNIVVFTNVPVFRAITNAPTRGPAIRFGFAGRTGGSFDNHIVDNLNITTFPAAANSGQPFLSVLRPVQLVNQTTGGNPTQINPVIIALQDLAYKVDTNSIVLRYNNNIVTPAVFRPGDAATVVVYSGTNGLLPTGQADVNIAYVTTSSPPLTNNFTYRFVVNAVAGSPGQANPATYPISAVDTTKPGFRAKVHQIDVNRNPATGIVPNAERQIANGYINPATGLPYDNTADLSLTNEPGAFTIEGVVNWNQDFDPALPFTEAGSFTSTSTPPSPDQPVPGIAAANVPNGNDRYVFSIETILDLKAGVYRFGVNSDDGFRLSIGRGPGDVVGMELGTAGDRGATDSLMDVYIPVDGFYPFRLMWWESGGGSSCEFFTQDFGTGAKTLVNDTNSTSSVKAYRASPVTPPYVSRALPTVNYGYAFPDQDVVIDVTDGAFPMDDGSGVLTINGTAQTVTANKTNNITTIRRAGSLSNLLPSGINNVRLVYSYTSGTTTMVTNDWAFTLPAYMRPIPAANKVASPTDVSGVGFRARAYQIDRSGDTNQGNGGRYVGQSGNGNNMPRPEIELAGGYINPTNNLPYPNLTLTGGNPPPNPDGTYDIGEVLNFSHAQSAGGPANNAGIFNLDTQVPGLPGLGTSNFGLDNSVHEFLTYLEFPAPGAYLFGLNVDDGWTVTSSPNARDTLGTLVGFRNGPGGQNGNPANNPNAAFNVIVPEAGIYPFRVLFWEGGGGVNMEFFTIDRQTGTQILVNDTAGTYPSVVVTSGQLISPIKAYNTYTGPTRPWTKFSVYPMPYIGTVEPRTTTGGQVTLWQNVHQQSGPGPILVKVGAGNPAGIANDEPRPDQALVNKPFGDAVGAVVADLGTGTVGLVLDGVSVTPTVTDIPASTDKLVLYTPPQPLSPSSNHVAGLVYAGTTNYWTFSVIAYTNVPTGVAQPSSQADPNAIGLLAKVFQTTNTQPNTVARAELQIAGLTNNVAVPNPNRPDGAYIITNIVNWNVTKNPGGTPTEIGNFQPILTGTPDEPVPGIPGTGLAGALRFENITAEIFAYLDLPAGYQKFGVNGDDGWKVQIGTPGQTTGTILFTRDRAAGARDIPFAFIAPEAGLYPVRLVWYQGGGGGDLEFFTYGPNNTKIAINDRTNPNAIKAYYNVITTPQLQFTSVSASGGNVTITWTGSGRLQEASSLTGNQADWSDVNPQPVGNTITVSASAAAQKFYRLTNP